MNCSSDPSEFFAPSPNPRCERCIYLYTGDRCNKPYSSEIFVVYNVVRGVEAFVNFVLMCIIIQRCYVFWKASPRWSPFNTQRRVYCIGFIFTLLMWPHVVDSTNYDLILPLWLVSISYSSATGCLMLITIEITFSLVVCAFPKYQRKMPNVRKFYTTASIIAFLLYVSLALLQYYSVYWLFRGLLLLFHMIMLYFLGLPANVFTFRLYRSIMKGEVKYKKASVAAKRVRTLLRVVLTADVFIVAVSLLQLIIMISTVKGMYTIHEPNAKLPPKPTTLLYFVRAFFDLFIWLVVFAALYIYRHVSRKASMAPANMVSITESGVQDSVINCIDAEKSDQELELENSSLSL